MEVTYCDKHSILLWFRINYRCKKFCNTGTSCVYYKQITIVKDDSSIVNKWCNSLKHHLLMTLEPSFTIVVCL